MIDALTKAKQLYAESISPAVLPSWEDLTPEQQQVWLALGSNGFISSDMIAR